MYSLYADIAFNSTKKTLGTCPYHHIRLCRLGLQRSDQTNFFPLTLVYSFTIALHVHNRSYKALPEYTQTLVG